MLINDLAASSSLDSKAMGRILGGNGFPSSPLLSITDIFAPSNQFAQQSSAAQAFTGPQSNFTSQSDNDVIFAAPGSQVINFGGNRSTSSNTASAVAASIPTLLQLV
jgi:hypothetical protein